MLSMKNAKTGSLLPLLIILEYVLATDKFKKQKLI